MYIFLFNTDNARITYRQVLITIECYNACLLLATCVKMCIWLRYKKPNKTFTKPKYDS